MWDFSKVPTSQYYHHSPPFLQNYYKISSIFSFFFPITKVHHSFPPQEACRNKYPQNWIENYVWRKRSNLDHLNLPFKEKEKEGEDRSKVWWPMEEEREGFLFSVQWKEKEKVFCLMANGRRRKKFFAWWPMEGEG